jgi:hypothetical protein
MDNCAAVASPTNRSEPNGLFSLMPGGIEPGRRRAILSRLLCSATSARMEVQLLTVTSWSQPSTLAQLSVTQ